MGKASPLEGVRACRHCGEEFHPPRRNSFVCSAECRSEENRGRYSKPSLVRDLGISTAMSGAISECRTCADLMAKGYWVFRSVSASSPSDLVAYKADGPMIRIDVKTYYRTGKVGSFLKLIDQGRCDVIAMATPEGIEYVPAIPE
jgi:hypothetical protein